MTVKELYESKFLDCWPRLNELRRQYAIEMWNATSRGELLALGSGTLNSGILTGFGNYHFAGGLGPNFTRIVDDPVLLRRCLEATDAVGCSSDMCGTLKITLGAMLMGEFAVTRKGDELKPDCIWDAWMCQAQPKTTQLWKEHYPSLPVVATELPAAYEHKDYLIAQWQEIIEQLSNATGREYDDERLINGLRAEWDVRRNWARICLAQRTIPAPLNQRWLHSMQALSFRGTMSRKENVEFFREAADEIEDRAKKGIAALAWERRRLLHEGMASFYHSPILEYPNRYGAIFIGSAQMIANRGLWTVDGDGNFQLGPTFEETGLPLRTRQDALEAFAKLYLQFSFSTRLFQAFDFKVSTIPKIADQWHVDGVVFPSSRACRGQSAGIQQSCQALRAKGRAVMIYENAPADPSSLDLAKYMSDMEAFVESMGLKQIGDYAQVEPPSYKEF